MVCGMASIGRWLKSSNDPAIPLQPILAIPEDAKDAKDLKDTVTAGL